MWRCVLPVLPPKCGLETKLFCSMLSNTQSVKGLVMQRFIMSNLVRTGLFLGFVVPLFALASVSLALEVQELKGPYRKYCDAACDTGCTAYSGSYACTYLNTCDNSGPCSLCACRDVDPGFGTVCACVQVP